MLRIITPSQAASRQALTLRLWRGNRRVLGSIAVALWLGALLVGMTAMQQFDFAPGDDGRAPKLWPSGSTIPRTAGLPTVVVLAHPRCPCTEATIEELAEVMARVRPEAVVYVSFYTPANGGEEWMQTAAWREAEAIPGVVVLKDENGRQAELFHATTSGRTLLCGEQGELLFEGGITAARGHRGENAGKSSLIALLSRQAAPTTTAPVFGCQLTSRCKK